MDGFSGSEVLVVGGAGFVGSNLVKELLARKAGRVAVVDNLLSSERENLPDNERLTFIEGSIADDRILAMLEDRFDFVFHLATYHGNQSSIHDPIADHDNNLITTLKLFNHLSRFKGVQKVVYSGAGCAVAEKTFDSAHATREADLVSLDMDSPYSISKIVGEYYSVYFHRMHGLPVVRARFQNVYGPGEILGAGQWRGTPATVWRNVTPAFIYKALNEEPLTLENEGLGSRDFIYVEDIVNGLICCALNGEPGDVYNIASGKEVTIAELADRINLITKNPAGIVFRPKRDWDRSGKRFGSTEKAKGKIGFEAKVEHMDGLRQTVAWTKKNMELIRCNIQKHGEQMAAYG